MPSLESRSGGVLIERNAGETLKWLAKITIYQLIKFLPFI